MGQAVPGTHDVEAMLATVRQEFEEMPGLTLTAEQARRLWALEPRVCGVVLERLVQAGYLCQTETGHYTKPSAA